MNWGDLLFVLRCRKGLTIAVSSCTRRHTGGAPIKMNQYEINALVKLCSGRQRVSRLNKSFYCWPASRSSEKIRQIKKGQPLTLTLHITLESTLKFYNPFCLLLVVAQYL
jgi:hypothetical protein